MRGSLLLEHCEDCTLWLASRQIRLHNSVRCTFHLRVMSNPIIEDCTELLFAPYNMRYEALEAQLEASDLGSVKTGMWSRVQDFKWHRAQHSPHWAELPPAQWVLEARCEGVELMSQPLRLPRDEDQG